MKFMNLWTKFLYTVSFTCLLCILCCSLTACKKTSDAVSKVSFKATVVSIADDTLLVTPDDDTKENQLCTQIYVPIDTQIIDSNGNDLDPIDLIKASHVLVTYDGILDNSDPAQITSVYEIQILD